MPTDLHDAPEIEYLDGIPHPKVSPRLSHAVVQRTIASLLAIQSQQRGIVGTELRCYPPSFRGKRTELVPDVAYISKEKALFLFWTSIQSRGKSTRIVPKERATIPSAIACSRRHCRGST